MRFIASANRFVSASAKFVVAFSTLRQEQRSPHVGLLALVLTKRSPMRACGSGNSFAALTDFA
jgi:hypothetical protein